MCIELRGLCLRCMSNNLKVKVQSYVSAKHSRSVREGKQPQHMFFYKRVGACKTRLVKKNAGLFVTLWPGKEQEQAKPNL